MFDPRVISSPSVTFDPKMVNPPVEDEATVDRSGVLLNGFWGQDSSTHAFRQQETQVLLERGQVHL